MTDNAPLSLAAIRSAREEVGDNIVRTPLLEARWLAELTGVPVSLKCENLQRTGSFKTRGAYLRLCRLSADERARGVVAASAGNHAQGVALSAQLLGIKATVFMPEGAPIPKVTATRGYGADVRFHGRYLDHAMEAAKQFAAETGAVFIHPYDHVDIVTGQGSCGLEIADQAPGVRTVVVPLGGGGLLAGIAVVMKGLDPTIRVIGVQAAEAAAYPPSLAAGAPQLLTTMRTMADGIACGLPGAVPFAAISELVDEVLTVSEASLARAVLALLERSKLVAEPAGAAAVAALLDHPEHFTDDTVVVVSGGNIDPLLLQKVIRHGLSAGGRHLALQVRISDLPGGLASLLADLAAVQANVIEVAHERIDPTLGLDEVAVQVQLETKGTDHARQVVEALRAHGHQVETA